MKKIIYITLTATLLLCLLTGCGKTGAEGGGASGTEPASTQNTWEAEPAAVIPMLPELDPEHLADGTYCASFSAKAVRSTEDGTVLTLEIYVPQCFEEDAVSRLKPGDTIVLGGSPVVIETMDTTDVVVINGEYSLLLGEAGSYQVYNFAFLPEFTPAGETELMLAKAFVFTDNSDLENPDVQMSLPEFLEKMDGNDRTYTPLETSVTVADGEITGITIHYTP